MQSITADMVKPGNQISENGKSFMVVTAVGPCHNDRSHVHIMVNGVPHTHILLCRVDVTYRQGVTMPVRRRKKARPVRRRIILTLRAQGKKQIDRADDWEEKNWLKYVQSAERRQQDH